MSTPIFSIIVATLNSGRTLERCIKSILDQTFDQMELLVIDGGSVDDSVAILENFDSRITYWKSESDQGLYHAFNKGIKNSRGKWLYFLGSDDILHSPRVLEEVNHKISTIERPARLIYGRVVLQTEGQEIVKITGKKDETRINYLRIPFDHQATFYHRSIFDEYGPYDQKFAIIADYEHQLRLIIQHRVKIQYIPVSIAIHPYGGISTLAKNRLMIFLEAEKIRNRFNIKVPVSPKLFKFSTAIFWTTLARIAGEKFARRFEEKLLQLEKRHFCHTEGQR